MWAKKEKNALTFPCQHRRSHWWLVGSTLGLLLLLTLITTTQIRAVVRTWDGGGADNNWSTCANWSGDACPTTADSVVFDGTSTKNATIDAAAPASLVGFSINSGYTGTITQGRTLTVNGSFSQAAGTFTGSTQTIDVSSFTLSGGSFTATTNTFSIPGNFTISGGTFNANGGTVRFYSNAATISCNSATFNLVSFTGQTSTKTISSNCSLPLGNNPSIPDNIILSGTLSGSGTLGGAGFRTLNSTAVLSGFTGLTAGALTINGHSGDFSSFTTTFTTGDISVTSSNLSLPPTANTGTITMSAGTLSASSTLLTINGALNLSGTATLTHNSGTITFTGNSNPTLNCNNVTFNRVTINWSGNGGGTIGSTCSLPLGSNPTLTGGTVSARAINLNGTISGSGTLTINSNGNALVINSSGMLTGFSGLNLNSIGLTVAGATVNFSGYTTFSLNGTLTISAGSLSLPAPTGTGINVSTFSLTGGSFTAAPGVMSVSSNFTVSGTPSFAANGGTINFSGGGSATLSCNNVSFNLVTINKTGNGGLTIGSNCSLPLGNSPTVVNGDTNSSAFTVNGTLSGSGTLTFTAAGSNGNLSLSPTGSLTGFSGLNTSGFTVAGATVNLSSYTPLSIGSGGLSVSGGTLTLPSGLTVTGGLTLSGGTLNAPSGNLTINGGLTVTGSPTLNPNGGTITFGGNNQTLSCGNLSFHRVALTFTNQITVNSNCSLPLGPDPTLPNTVILSGVLSGSGTLTQTTGQLNMQGSSNLSGFTGLTGTSNSLRLNGNTLNVGSYTTFNLPAGFTMNTAGSSFTAPSGVMNVGDNFSITAGTFNPNGGTVNFNGGTATVSCNNQPFNLVTFSGQTGTKTISSNCSLPLGNNPVIPNGITTNAPLSGSGTITMTTGTLTMNTGSSLSGFTGLTGTSNQLSVAGGTANLSGYTTLGLTGTTTLSGGSLTHRPAPT